jgi:hypothetical protein
MDDSRPFRIVTGVVRELLRSTGKVGIALAGKGPEATLLAGWMSRAGLRLDAPPKEAVRRAQALLGGVDVEAGTALEWARCVAALAIAVRDDLLLANPANKTLLVLAPDPPLEPLLPMGDLYAHEIRALVGDCTVPACLLGSSDETLAQVDSGLKDYLERHAPFGEAFEGVDPSLAEAIREALRRSRRNWYSRPLIPKLADATLGMDLDL